MRNILLVAIAVALVLTLGVYVRAAADDDDDDKPSKAAPAGNTQQAADQRQAVRKKLRAAAKTPQFQAAVKKLTELTGVQPKKLETDADGDDTGGVVFTVKHAKADELLTGAERKQLLAQGAFLFRFQNGHGLALSGQELPDEIALLPTKDKYEVLAAVETEGPNSGHYNADVIKFLKDLEKTQPFELTEAGSDYLAGNFATAVKDPAALAKQLFAFCTDVEEAKQVELLKKGKLYLWWD